MTNEDAVKWLENLRQDIGQLRHEDLWNYEQAIVEIMELLEEQETENLYKCPNCGTWVSAENVVRCKYCKHRGNSEKCVLSAISEEKDFPLFMLDNRGDWFCADGKRRDSDG